VKHRLGMLIAVLLLSAAVPARARPAVVRFALVIGNNSPEAGGQALQFADDDAVSLHEVLREAGVESRLLASPDDDTHRRHPETSPAGPPRLAVLQREARSLFAAMRREAEQGSVVELFLFFSGHGSAVDGEGYIVLEGGRFSRSALAELLADSPAAVNHVFVDACSSFLMAYVAQKNSPAEPGREPYTQPLPFQQLPGDSPNTGFVLSTASERDSHEWARYHGGILSHELRSALRGAADSNLDGYVSYRELTEFLRVANEGVTNPNFRPTITVNAPAGDLDRALIGRSPEQALVRVRGGHIEHFFVEDGNGVRLLDAHPEAGHVVMLWLPATRPIFVRANDEPKQFKIERGGPITIDQLYVTEDFSRKGGGALGEALKELFRLPYGPSRFSQAPLRVSPERPPQADASSARIAAASVALGASAAGMVFSALSLSAYLERDAGSQPQQADRRDDFQTYSKISIPCYAVAAGAGTLWALLGFFPNLWGAPAPGGSAASSSPTSTESANSISISPVISGAGLGVAGTF